MVLVWWVACRGSSIHCFIDSPTLDSNLNGGTARMNTCLSGDDASLAFSVLGKE